MAQGDRVIVLGEDALTRPFVSELLLLGLSPETSSLVTECREEALVAFRDRARAVICVQGDVTRVAFGEGLLASRYLPFLADQQSVIAAVEVVRAELLVEHRVADEFRGRDPVTMGARATEAGPAFIPAAPSPSANPQVPLNTHFDPADEVFRAQLRDDLGAGAGALEEESVARAKRAFLFGLDGGFSFHSGMGPSYSFENIGAEVGLRFGGATSVWLRGSVALTRETSGSEFSRQSLSPQVRYDLSSRPDRGSIWFGAGFTFSNLGYSRDPAKVVSGPMGTQDLLMTIDGSIGGTYWITPGFGVKGAFTVSLGGTSYNEQEQTLASYGPLSALFAVGAETRLPY